MVTGTVPAYAPRPDEVAIISPLHRSASWRETALLQRASLDVNEEVTCRELGPCKACRVGLELGGGEGGHRAGALVVELSGGSQWKWGLGAPPARGLRLTKPRRGDQPPGT